MLPPLPWQDPPDPEGKARVHSDKVAQFGFRFLRDSDDQPRYPPRIGWVEVAAHVIAEPQAAFDIRRIGRCGTLPPDQVLIPNAGCKGPRLDQHDADAERVRLNADCFAPPLKRMLGGAVGLNHRCCQQPCDRRQHDDVSRVLPAHHRQDSFGHGDVAKEVGLEIKPDLGERQILGKAGDGEAGVVYQDINAAILAHHLLNEGIQSIKFRNVECTIIESGAGVLCGFIERLALMEAVHGCDHAEAGKRHVNSREQPKAARTARNYGDLLIHSDVSCNRTSVAGSLSFANWKVEGDFPGKE